MTETEALLAGWALLTALGGALAAVVLRRR